MAVINSFYAHSNPFEKASKILLLFCLVLVLLSCKTPVTSNSKILCISAPNGLMYTDNDIDLVADAFGRYVGFERNNIKRLYGNESYKNRIKSEIHNWLSQGVNPNDLVILFLAGHGYLVDGEYYFAPQVREGHLLREYIRYAREGRLISRKELVQAINSIPSKHKMLIIDTCTSGAFIEAPSRNISSLNNARSVVRGITLSPKSGQGTGSQPDDKVDFAVLAACQPGQDAYGLGNGILTYCLVRLLKKGAKSRRYFDVKVICEDIKEMAKDVIKKMAEDDGLSQEPIADGGEFFRIPLKPDWIQHFVIF